MRNSREKISKKKFLKPVLDGLENSIYTDQFYFDHDDFFSQNEGGEITITDKITTNN